MNGGHAYNALPQTATVNVNCRIVPTSTLEEVRATIARVVNDTTIKVSMTVESREKFGVAPDAIDPTLLGVTTSLTRQIWGDIPVIPTMSRDVSVAAGVMNAPHLALAVPAWEFSCSLVLLPFQVSSCGSFAPPHPSLRCSR